MARPDIIWRTAFEQAATPLAVLDGRGILALWNRSFGELLRSLVDQGPERFRGSFLELIREREGARLDYYAAELLLGGKGSARVETPFRAADGRKLWLEITISLLEPGILPPIPSVPAGPLAAQEGRFLLLSIEDGTDRVVREHLLQEAKEGAEKATHTKSLFLANMSHEIRTPIQTILGVLELLGETRLDDEQSEYATQVRFSAEVLLGLINDILDFSKIEAGKLNLEATDFDLPSLVYQSVYLLVMDAHRKNLEVIVDLGEPVPATVRGDPTRLRQIIVNLLKNAIKFTNEGAVALVMRLVGGPQRNVLRFEVRDTGIGIPEELRDRLFTAFFQADFAAARKTGGTGLGLAISRRLVELMGGRIGVQANSPRGSVFWFELPLDMPEYAMPTTTAGIEIVPRKVLVVDDSPEALTLIARTIARAGYEVAQAASGDEAMDALRSATAEGRPFEICLIDLNMPRMDGWRLAAEIKGEPSISGASLILMVPEGTLGGEAKMKLLSWFEAYLSKPIRPTQLLALLASAGRRDGEGTGPKRVSTETSELDPVFEAEVLIAEDHEVNRELFSLILSRLGCRVTAAADGLEAAAIGGERAREGRPFDVILTDLIMPRMNGYELSAALRAQGYRGPLVAVTASAMKGEREKCLDAGMDDILLKPFKKHDLAVILERWLPESKGGRRVVAGGDREAAGLATGLGTGQAGVGMNETRPPAPIADSAPAPSKEVLDFDSVLDTFLGQESTVERLLVRFVEKAGTQLGDLGAALEAKDLDAFGSISHSIKGAAWNLAAGRLGDAAKAGEEAGRKGDEKEAGASLLVMREAFEGLRTAVSRKYDRAGRSPTA